MKKLISFFCVLILLIGGIIFYKNTYNIPGSHIFTSINNQYNEFYIKKYDFNTNKETDIKIDKYKFNKIMSILKKGTYKKNYKDVVYTKVNKKTNYKLDFTANNQDKYVSISISRYHVLNYKDNNYENSYIINDNNELKEFISSMI